MKKNVGVRVKRVSLVLFILFAIYNVFKIVVNVMDVFKYARIYGTDTKNIVANISIYVLSNGFYILLGIAAYLLLSGIGELISRSISIDKKLSFLIKKEEETKTE